MKRLCTLLILSSLFIQNHGMESSFPSETVPDEKVIIIQTTDSDGSTVEFSVEESVIKESETIKDMLEDMDLKEEIRIPLDRISAYDFKTLVPYLQQVAATKYKIEEEQIREKLTLIATLKTHSIDELAAITNHANFLNIPILLDCCIEAMAQKLTMPKSLQQFVGNHEYVIKLSDLPADLSNAIAQKIIQHHDIPTEILRNFIPTKPTTKLRNNTEISLDELSNFRSMGKVTYPTKYHCPKEKILEKIVPALRNFSSGGVHRIACSSNDQLLVFSGGSTSGWHDIYAGNSTVFLFDISDPENLKLLKKLAYGDDYYITSVALHANNQLLSVAMSNRRNKSKIVCLYNISDPKNPQLLKKIAPSSPFDEQHIKALCTSFSPNQFFVFEFFKEDPQCSVCSFDISLYNEIKNFIEKKLSIKQALFLIACFQQKISKKIPEHLLEIFESLPKNLQQALQNPIQENNDPLSSSSSSSSLNAYNVTALGIFGITAGYLLYKWFKK